MLAVKINKNIILCILVISFFNLLWFYEQQLCLSPKHHWFIEIVMSDNKQGIENIFCYIQYQMYNITEIVQF